VKQREAYKDHRDRYLTTKEPKSVPKELIASEVVRMFLRRAKLKDEEISQIEERTED
jgi:hypothetical protein